jgi:hypothetical protein
MAGASVYAEAPKQPGRHEEVPMNHFVLFLRRYGVSITTGCLLTLISQASLSQRLPSQLPSGQLAWPGLTPDDVDRMSAAAARLYEGRSIGTVERWRNPDTKDAGEVKLVRMFEANGMPCRTVDYLIRFETTRNIPRHFVSTWCKIPDDDWKIVELPRPK